jgi:hypothetical protein
MVLGVDALAIVVYYLAHLGRTGSGTRLAFTAAWMAATLLVALIGLTRIRRARLEALNRR